MQFEIGRGGEGREDTKYNDDDDDDVIIIVTYRARINIEST